MAIGNTNAQALNPTEITNAISRKVDKKSSGATYGIATPDTSTYTSDRTIATTDDVATKLDKDTTTSTYDQSYVKKADGTQALRSTTSQRVASSIVMRDANNQINVADTPTSNSHATSKKYVDDLILKIYPIGAIYTSSNNTNPSTLFGGTWTALNGGNPVYIPKGDVPVITKSTEHDLASANLKIKFAESNYANRLLAIDGSRQVGVDQNTTGSIYSNSQIHPTNLYTKADTTYSIGVYMWERTA